MHEIAEVGRTMSSREIGVLTNKRHADVKRDIERMLVDLKEDVSRFARIYFDSMNREQTEYALDRELTETLLTGYSAPLRRAVIVRWRELEAAPPVANLDDPHTLRALLLSYSGRVLELDAKIAADAPKVEFAEQVRALDGVCSIEAIAKTLGYGRNKFFKSLRADGILMENRLPYQKYIDRCYFTVVENAPYTDSEGKTHPTFTTRVTGAGQVFLQRKYGRRKEDIV
jgi:phage antirepressor YoqD-like protein